MKNFKARLAGILACLLLFIVPLQADAGWNASPLPAASINTVFGDSTYLNPEWMTKKVTITWNGNTWMTGMDAFKDMPVRLTNNNGAIDCTFLNTAVFQSYFSAINASIASMTTTAAVPVFDNGAGSYIRISGTQHTEAVSSMPDWLAQMLHSLILPGQTVSVSDTILPRTRANGYKEAGVYVNGAHTSGLGGGVCQISSTVYNAVKNAGLTVVQRNPHSMPVNYLPKGLDAAIAAGSKDLKFRNDYTTPVVLYTDTSNKHLTVNVLVWNQELAGRSFKLWAKQTGALSADTYFTTYQDGKEVSTQFVGTSRYNPYREAVSND